MRDFLCYTWLAGFFIFTLRTKLLMFYNNELSNWWIDLILMCLFGLDEYLDEYLGGCLKFKTGISLLLYIPFGMLFLFSIILKDEYNYNQ